MSKMCVFESDNLGIAKESTALPERLIEGNPQFKSWDVDSDKDGKVRAGIWEATPGITRSIKGETWEFCHILSGVAEISEDGGETIRVEAGSSFVLKPGFLGVRNTIETLRKIWVVA